MKNFMSDLQFYGTARIGEDQYAIKQASDGTFYLEKTSAGQRRIVASGFPDIETAQKSAGELVQPVSENVASTGQQAAPAEISPQERGASVETITSGSGMSVEEARQFLSRKSDTGEPLIFGRLFSEIAGMQQKERPMALRITDRLKAAKQIAGDIVKFKIPVAQEVVDAYGITLPEGYVCHGDIYVFAPPTTNPAKA